MSKRDIAEFVDSVGVKLAARIFLLLLVPISMFGLAKLYDMNNAIVTLQAQMTERTADRYTATDAMRDGKNYITLIGRNQDDIRTLYRNQAEMQRFIYQNVPNRH